MSAIRSPSDTVGSCDVTGIIDPVVQRSEFEVYCLQTSCI